MEEDGPAPDHLHGRLRRHVAFWRAIHATNVVLSWITGGLPLFLRADAPLELRHFSPNHASCWADAETAAFVSESVAKLCETGAAMEVFSPPACIFALGVARHARTCKRRLIHDQRPLNAWVECERFRYESIQTVREVAQPGDCCFSFDL